MEATSTNPVLVTFSTHYEVSVWNRPELPGSVIRSCCHDVLLWVVTQTGDRHQVSFKRLDLVQVRTDSFKCLIEGRVKSFPFWNRCRFACHFQCTLCCCLLFLRRFLTCSTTNLRRRKASFRLALEPFGLRLFLSLLFLHLPQIEFKVVNFSLESVFLQLHEHFLFESSLVFVSVEIKF